MLSEQQLREFQGTMIREAENWQISGYTFVKWDEQTLIDRPFGYADRENEIPATVDTRYCLSGAGQSIIALCYLLLCERGVIHPLDKLSRYIPEYRQAGRIRLIQLIQHSSGVPGYFYGRKMLKLQNDPAHLALTERERYVKELALSGGGIAFSGFLELIEGEELEFEPGLKTEYSESECLLLAETMARAAGKSYPELLRELVFAPLGMEGVRLESGPAAPRYGVFRRKEFLRVPELPVQYAFTADVSDLVKLLDALCERRLLSEQGWKKAMKRNADGDSIMCNVIDGFSVFSLNASGGGADLYFNQELHLRFCYVTGADRLSVCDTSGNYDHFPKQLRDAVAAATTYPHQPHVVPYGKQNWMDACSLRVRQDQTDFVSDVRTCIAAALAFKSTHKAYVMQEDERPVGLLMLEVDKKKNIFWIDTVLIDKRYQGRGYGRIMTAWGVEELKRQGAKQLSIGVNRFNIPAQRLYASLGFRPAEVHEQFVMMQIDLAK